MKTEGVRREVQRIDCGNGKFRRIWQWTVEPAAKVAVAGTVATPVLLELRLTVTPPVGAGADRFSVTFWVTRPVMVKLASEKLAVAVTCTDPLPEV